MAPQHILVATDFSPPADRALELAKTLHGALGAAVELIHVHVDPFDGYAHSPELSLWGNAKQFEAYMLGLDMMLKNTVKQVFGSDAQTVSTSVVRGVAAETIVSAAEERNADLICVGTTGKGAVQRALMGSVALGLLRKSPIPVLTVH